MATKRLAAAMVCAVLTLSLSSSVEADDLPPVCKVLDGDLIMFSWPYPTISPDGRRVAYISHGQVCVVEVAGGAPRRLLALPDTWTDALARPEFVYAHGDFGALARGKSREEYRALLALVTSTAFGLRWTVDSQGVIFGTQSYDKEKQCSLSDVWLAPVDGKPEKLAHLEQHISHRGVGNNIHLTRDRRYLVWAGEGKPLIWDIAKGRPRAACFLNLTPSATSGRWIGIEKDTRQLVVTDEEFNITHRYEDFVPTRSYGAELIWSPDERYVILRNAVGFDHYSNWEGYRLDLKTNQRRILTGSYWIETIAFTGRGGEFVREASEGIQGGFSGLIQTASSLQIVPDGDGPPKRLWGLRSLPGADGGKEVRLRSYHHDVVRWSPDFEFFIIGVPRQSGPYGIVAHLVDRERRLWRLPGDDAGAFNAPYSIVGFANGGKTIVGYDQTRLFALPTSAVMTDENKVTVR
jgi:hypothetical protein